MSVKFKTPIPQPKYSIGDQVYVYSKEGIIPFVIKSISILIEEEKISIAYRNSNYDGYEEKHVMESKKTAIKKATENINQLQLLIE